MGFIKAFQGAIGGMFADQWVDFLVPPTGLAPTAALFPAVAKGTDAGRGANTKGSEHVITNGSKIVVPEGYALLTFQDGELTGLIAEPGGYEYASNHQQSQSVFTGGGFISPTVMSSWERFKFGGQPATQQLAFYVNLKEIPNNRFGTQSEIYWDDAYLGAQVGAITRGTYSLRIIDPVLFAKQFVPYAYLGTDARVFDFGDFDNDAATQLFNEVVSSLAPAFSIYTNDPSKGNRMARIQGDSLGFAQSLSHAVEQAYQWASGRGLVISQVAIQAIEYDEDTRKLLSDVKKADALSGNRGASFLQQSVARGFESAGQNSGGQGIAMMGMGMNAAGGAMNFQQNPNQPAPYQNPFQQGQQPQQQASAPQGQPQQGQPQQTSGAPATVDDSVSQLAKFKQMLDQGLISQDDYDAAKRRALGLD
ncbi:virion core protein (lumpy skin disease virus) [Pseudoclavibacter endophyticus]|uniref:SPFH domain-containing protein n=1 Tax=Pseudoclavibacter endophyticus TaxID=1778590 RepID=A0A6H9WLP9_9MICO|nr:SPFH domain-containing protein [Pseudoclavibacter endophyticus]KAB1648978.1 SPFH domain-containing protein [Pseudoclavibacter endophyticus]GGA66591.1 virion core protein (lumpy skin disease virus) [Pseudoclavibacter endophyticus]